MIEETTLAALRLNVKLETDLEMCMKPKMPQHCKGCTSFHNAGRRDPKGGLEKYNAWCCRNGQPAHNSIGWCKTHNMKVSNVELRDCALLRSPA